MRLSALDCLRRGWTNLSANWELVVIQWLQSFLVAALTGLGLLLPLLIVGANLFGSGNAARQAEAAARRLADLSPALLLALIAMLAVWTLSLLLHCWFAAGILISADRQALPGSRRNRDFFRTFSPRDFLGWGTLYVWRFLRLLLVFWGAVFLLAGAIVSWLVFMAAGGGHWGSPAALGIGCGGSLPLGFLALVTALWFGLAQADLAREGSTVRVSSRRGLDVLGRRLGSVVFLFVLVTLAALALAAVVFFPLAAVADALLAGAPLMRGLVHFLLLLIQSFPNTLLAMVLAGALVALVRSETPSEFRRNPEVATA
jgi:hypothetical protein